MSETDTYWFHCGACGRLFSEEADFSEDRSCPHCGQSPSPLTQAAPPVRDANLNQAPVVLEQSREIDGRNPRRTRAGFKVLLGWLVLMAVIFAVAHWLRDRDGLSSADSDSFQPEQSRRGLSDQDREFVDSALPACRELLARFLTTPDIDSRLPLVLPHSELRQHMERYYADNELLKVEPETLSLKASTLVDLPEGRTLLTQWETEEGASFDAAFRQSQGEWRLDWHHFERYSDLSWPLFLAGSGVNDVAEFRLHARKRVARKDDPGNGIGVVLSAPMRRHLKGEGFSQSMMGLSLDEADGKLLEEAFALEAENKPILGAEFRDINPDAMIRVRVRVRRIGEEGGNSYHIVKVLACHWYQSTASGLE